MRGRYNDSEENDLTGIIKNMSRRIDDLEKGAGIGNTAIDSGDLAVKNGSFSVGALRNVYFGPVTSGIEVNTGWILKRADGTIAFYLAGASNDDQYWAMLDNAGNIIVSDDGGSDMGLARPYLPIPFVPHSNTVPTDTTTSGTFTSLLTGRYHKQHPYVRVEVLARASDGSTSGELQLRDGTNSVILTTTPVAVGLGAYGLFVLGPVYMNVSHMSTVELEVQARRTAGAGTIGVRVMAAYGEQSP